RSGSLGDTGLGPVVAGADEIFGDEFAAVDHRQVDAQNRPELDGAGQVDVGVDGTGQGSGVDFIVRMLDYAHGIENIVEIGRIDVSGGIPGRGHRVHGQGVHQYAVPLIRFIREIDAVMGDA